MKTTRKSLFLKTVFATAALCVVAGCASTPPGNAAAQQAVQQAVPEGMHLELKGAPTATLAKGGKALMKVIVAKAADKDVQTYAQTLADYLGRISGAKFTVTTGDGSSGIVVGLQKNFASLKAAQQLKGTGPASKEQYLLQTHKNGLYVIGKTPLAVRDAVWGLLYRMGYRQFFPSETWEYVPSHKTLQIAVHTIQEPDYLYRHIRMAYGSFGYNGKTRQQWTARNRMDGATRPNWGHAYGHIIHENMATFKKHPEYLGLLSDKAKPHGRYAKEAMQGNRKSDKLNVGNPGLQKLAIQYAINYFKKNPEASMISMDPSDGGGWGHSPESLAIGTPSDRALFLANVVARGLRQHGFKDKYVGMYAYASHSAPPTKVRADPNVVIGAATAFLKGGLTVDQIINGWKKMGVRHFGMREYYSIYAWAHDLPRASHASNLIYLQKTIPHFYHEGAQYMDAEAGTQWGPCGLGFYLASRMLWNVNEAQNMDALIDDFLDKAFGKARAPMARFYQLINVQKGTPSERLSDDMVGKMYRYLDEAMSLAQQPVVKKRLEALALYTHYVELYRVLVSSKGAQRQANYETLMKYVYRIRKRNMLQTKEIYRAHARVGGVKTPKAVAWNVPEAKNAWKQSTPYTHAEVMQIIKKGIADNPLRGFEVKTFSHNLVPAADFLHAKKDKVGAVTLRARGTRHYYTWITKAPATIKLKITGGMISWYRDRGNVRVTLSSLTGGNKTQQDFNDSVPPDGKPHTIEIHTKQSGLHEVTISDGHDRTNVGWPVGLPVTFESSGSSSNDNFGRWGGVFYVPKGTKVIGGYSGGARGSAIISPDGKKAFDLAHSHGYFKVPVPAGQDGKIWRISKAAGKVLLLTVPPFVAPNAADLLLPKEVVQ